MIRLTVLNVTYLALLPFLTGDEPPALVTAADLDSVVFRLKAEDTRPVALEQLINLGSLEFYKPPSFGVSSGIAERDVLIRKAAKYVQESGDFANIRMALESARPTLQYWALFVFPTGEEDQKEDRWRALIPRVRELAKSGPAQIRGQAQEVLQRLDGQTEFLARRAEAETELSNIMRLVYGGNGAGFQGRMRPHVHRLLRNPDEKVRRDALTFIGFSPNHAPMWQLEFTDEEFRRVLELSRSQSDRERACAVYALTAMQFLDPAALRARMIQLADDPSEDVRWRIPGALAGQKDRADVQALLSRFLRDDSASVRYFTILELGPKNHVAELRAMASGRDKKYAEWAADKLKQLGLEKE